MLDQRRIASLFAEVGADTTKFERGMRGVEDHLTRIGRRSKRTFGGMLTGIGKVAGGVVVAQGAMRAFGAVTSMVSGSIFGMNATLETASLQFETLMGDSDAAKQHVEGLFDFAKKTPFETDPIIEASRMLQTFGGSALNTTENLMLFGDAAAATNAPFQGLGFWVGRLYSQLQAGRPFGEAAMRLQELAVLSPQARNQMEALQKAGKSTDEIWRVFTQDMARFTGAMERQQTTWSGLTSTFSDSIQLLGSTAFKPLFDFVKRGLLTINELIGGEGAQSAVERFAGLLQGLLDRVRTLVGGWIEGLSNMDRTTARSVGRIAGFFFALAKSAVQWGMNIVSSLAAGITQALSLVSLAVQKIGEIIGFWLAPGSPPKLLPDLDKWGKSAAEEYIRGWTTARVDAAVDHLRKGLDRIRGLQEDIRDQQRLATIQQALEAGGGSPLQRQALLLEQQEIQMRARLRLLEREKQARKDVAEETAAGGRGKKGIGIPSLSGIGDAFGKALEGAGEKLQPFNLGLEKMSSLWDEAKLGFDEGQLAFENFQNSFSEGGLSGLIDDLSESMGGLSGNTGRLADALERIAGLADRATEKAGLFRSGLIGIGTAFVTFKVLSKVAQFAGALQLLATVISEAGGVSSALGALVALLGGPVTLAIAGIAAVVGTLAVAWANDWGGIATKTTDFWDDYIEPVFGDWDRFMSVILPAAIADFKGDLRSFTSFITGTFNSIIEGVTGKFDSLKSSLSSLTGEGGPIKRLLSLWDDLVAKADAVRKAIENLPIIGHSPSPLEISLRAVNEQLGALDRNMGRVAGVRFPNFGGQPQFAPVTAGHAINITIEATIANDMDLYRVARQVGRIIQENQ